VRSRLAYVDKALEVALVITVIVELSFVDGGLMDVGRRLAQLPRSVMGALATRSRS